MDNNALKLHLLCCAVDGSRRSCTLLNAIQKNRNDISVRNLLNDCDFPETDPILHQGTFLGFAYITLVLLWETVRKRNKEACVIKDLDFDFKAIKKISGPRQLESGKPYLRIFRNGLSHANVEIKRKTFIFGDIDIKTEKKETFIEISWEDLARLSDAFMRSAFKHFDPDKDELSE